tara:strand:- start:389 stop:790 length:402 start_codon:yes stop_codon:yes gene_type:complete
MYIDRNKIDNYLTANTFGRDKEQDEIVDALEDNMNGGITDAQREISEAANDKDYNDSKTDLMIKLLEDVIRRDKVLLNAEVQELYNEHDENDRFMGEDTNYNENPSILSLHDYYEYRQDTALEVIEIIKAARK